MIRTRDFLLFLIIMAFLVVTISIQTTKHWFGTTSNNPTVLPIDFSVNNNEPTEFGAELITSQNKPDRAKNIAHLREQLAFFIATVPKPTAVVTKPTVEDIATSTSTTLVSVVETGGPAWLCSGYQTYAGAWPKQLLNIEERAGARVVLEPSSTGGDDVVVILPIRVIGNISNPHCLPTDVVAIAQTGSLIRNGDVAGYRAFPEHILIGYTLDGYPLYGYSERETDRCGGAMVDETYRYYLANKRETVLDCFVAPPISLPNFD